MPFVGPKLPNYLEREAEALFSSMKTTFILIWQTSTRNDRTAKVLMWPKKPSNSSRWLNDGFVDQTVWQCEGAELPSMRSRN